MIKSVTQWLDSIAERFPDKVAFGEDKAGTLTFLELCTAARNIGSIISDRGFFKEPVMIAMDKVPQCVAAMLGAAYANCPYVPIDVGMPAGRIRKIIDKLRPVACIAGNDKHAKLLCESGVSQGDILLYDEIVNIKENQFLLESVHKKRISTDLLYIIFTSGSTGDPKGVAVNNHSNVIDYTMQLSEKFKFDEKTVFGQSIPFFFDSTLLYVYQTIYNGCTDWILSKTDLIFPIKTIEFLNRHQCNTIYWVPTSYNIIAKSGVLESFKPSYLHTCVFVGEVMPNSVLNVWRRAIPDATFINLFGPTEITGTFLYYIVDREFLDDDPLPIGRPYENNSVILLNENDTETASGNVGEMCVRGAKVSGGYWNDPQKTAEVFVQNPLNTNYREIIYKTGDLAYINERGEFMFSGRRDFQIKLAGQRIELGEIEAQAGSVLGVELCACVFDPEKQKITLFYTGNIDSKELRSELRKKLQEYMIPASMERIDSMPRTGSGKINRVALKGP